MFYNLIINKKGAFGLYANTCVETCPTGTFFENNVCTQCAPGCTSCINLAICLKCYTPGSNTYYMQPMPNMGACLQSCPAGFYRIIGGATAGNSCGNCNPMCKRCDGPNTDNCLACWDTYKLNNKKCVPHCFNTFDTFTVATNEHECQSCYSGCQKCTGTNANSCYKCNNIIN